MTKNPTIPSIKYFNPDLVDLYEKSWIWISKSWKTNDNKDVLPEAFLETDDDNFDYFYSLIPTFFLSYSAGKFNPEYMIDYFYSKQESNGSINAHFSKKTGKPTCKEKANPDIMPPIFAAAELFLYNKNGDKKRLKNVISKIKAFYEWLFEVTSYKKYGLLKTDRNVSLLGNVDRLNAAFLVDFNCVVAYDLLCLYEIGDLLNDSTVKMFAKPNSDKILCNVRDMMWSNNDGFLYDLDINLNIIKNQHIGGIFYLLSNEVNYISSAIIEKLKDPNYFDTYNIFPTVPKSSPQFKKNTDGFYGGCSSILTYFVIKGLEKKGEYAFATSASLRHSFTLLDSLSLDDNGEKGDVWEVYKNEEDGPVPFKDNNGKEYYPHKKYLTASSLITISLMLENIIGMNISIPQKTVSWTIETYQEMGIVNFPLKHNSVSIECLRNTRGWEVRIESEKLYYFKFAVLSENKVHNLPIPSGKCSLLPEKF